MITPELFYASLLMLAGAYKKDELHFKNVQKPGYTLVACSTRENECFTHHFLQELWNAKNIDLSYSNNQNVITLDRKNAFNKGKHIIADLCKQRIIIPNVKRIYLERPETINRAVQGIQNNVGIYVYHLLPSLPNDGELTIEWHPFLSLSFRAPADMSPHEIEADLAECNKHDPFTGYLHGDYCVAITKKVLNQQKEQSTSDANHQLKDLICKRILGQFLDFYATHQSASREELCKRLRLETEIIDRKKSIDKTSRIFIPVNGKVSVEEFNKTVTNMAINTITKNNSMPQQLSFLCLDLATGKRVDITRETLITYKEFIADDTLFSYLWSDITVLMNGQLAIECLQKLGLKNVTLWRGTSPYNGRKNVWLLRGYKKSQEDLILDEADAELQAILRTSSHKQ